MPLKRYLGNHPFVALCLHIAVIDLSFEHCPECGAEASTYLQDFSGDLQPPICYVHLGVEVAQLCRELQWLQHFLNWGGRLGPCPIRPDDINGMTLHTSPG